MGESLCYSWLKHIKGCQVVQTNWKPSLLWNHDELNKNLVKMLADKNPPNIYKQTECDVLGIFDDEKEPTIFAVEVAFHENGLDYGGNYSDTAKKIKEKCIRIAACTRACFPQKTIKIFFASPSAPPGLEQQVNEEIENLNSDIKKIDNKITVETILADDFKKRIAKPLVLRYKHIADTSDLFIRSCKILIELGLMNPNDSIDKDYLEEIEPVADIARNYMIPILKNMKVSDEDFKVLMQANDSTFKMGWPVISTNRVLIAGNQRYYAEPFKCTSTRKFFLTNYWLSSHNKEQLINWIIAHKYALNKN